MFDIQARQSDLQLMLLTVAIPLQNFTGFP